MANSLSRTKWLCKYHIVFIPKYKRKVIYHKLRADIQGYIRGLCKWKGVEIIEGHMMADHVHLLLSIPPKQNISIFKGYLKGKSSIMILITMEILVKVTLGGHIPDSNGKDMNTLEE